MRDTKRRDDHDIEAAQGGQGRAGMRSRAILCMLKTSIHDHIVYRIRFDELRTIVETLGVEVVGEFVQIERRPTARFLIGSGKVEELHRYVKAQGVELAIFYNLLRSSQKLNLIRALGCDVVDRYEVTLEIFDRMATDSLSKLQIEAARLEKLAPYLKLEASIRFHNDRPFFLSMGEYAYHSQLRELTRRQARIKEQIEELRAERQRQIGRRRSLDFPTICVAGFYNAGKTSLFNALTGERKPVSSLPFTTLSSKYQRRYIDPETTLLFIDTIGFVIDLDPRLIGSFELNLQDIRSADLVLLMLSISDPDLTLRIKLMEGVKLLTEIGVPRERIVVVFNKLDLAPGRAELIGEVLDMELQGLPWTTVSAKEKINLDGLLLLITERLRELNVPPAKEVEEVAAISDG